MSLEESGPRIEAEEDEAEKGLMGKKTARFGMATKEEKKARIRSPVAQFGWIFGELLFRYTHRRVPILIAKCMEMALKMHHHGVQKYQ